MGKYGNKKLTARKDAKEVSLLRVISGRYRGISLKSPLNSGTHPMGAREKLALFNMVNMEGARVLDAYAGSGALGIEALSRGASEVVFVEANRAVGRVLQENLGKIGIDDGTEVQGSADGKVKVLLEKVEKFADNPEYQGYFDVVIADPPYGEFENVKTDTASDMVMIAEVERLVDLVRVGGVLVLSSPADLGEIELEGVRISSTHTYARARITVYRRG